jgi:aquaporin Z
MIGTFTLVAIGPGAAMVAGSTHAFGPQGVALAFGLAVTLVVAAIGESSGAHINPAVTIGWWFVGRLPGRAVLPYVVAQCLGAIAAAGVLRWLLGPVVHLGATVPGLTLARSFVVEGGFSAILGYVIMALPTDRDARTAPFVVGATIFAGALVSGPLTGGSFNPARSLGPAVFGHVWSAHWLYWLAPILGVSAGMRLQLALASVTRVHAVAPTTEAFSDRPAPALHR